MESSFGGNFPRWGQYADGRDKVTEQAISTVDARVYRRRGVKQGTSWHLAGPGEEVSFRLVGIINKANTFRIDVCEAMDTIDLDRLTHDNKRDLLKTIKDIVEEEHGVIVPPSFTQSLLMDAREI